MYAREKAGLDPVWRGRIVDFFHYLTQAVGKVDTAAMVASLLATDPNKQQGELGGRLMSTCSTCSGANARKGSSRCRRRTCRKCCADASSNRTTS